MEFSLQFIMSSVLLGFGLAMDAFSVSIANGLQEEKLSAGRSALIAGTFGLFQTGMPLAGWLCVRTVAETFQSVQRVIPWIAMALLGWIGIRMIISGFRGRKEYREPLRGRVLLLQGLATSIDALSAGFALEAYALPLAAAAAVIIGIVTFCLCCAGLHLGRKIGELIAEKAGIAGGVILLLIGVRILIGGIS